MAAGQIFRREGQRAGPGFHLRIAAAVMQEAAAQAECLLIECHRPGDIRYIENDIAELHGSTDV